MKKKNAKPSAEDINPLEKLGEQADEIVGILADLGQSPAEEQTGTKSKVRKAAAAKTVAPKAATVEVKAEAPKAGKKAAAKPAQQAEQPQPAEAFKPAEAEAAAPVAEQPQAPATPVAPAAPKKEDKKEKSHFLRDTLICVVILLLLLLVGYFFLRHQISSWLDSLNNPQPVQTEVVAEPEEPVVAETTEAPAVVEEIVYDKLITTERMHQHSRLAWMAWRYYGNKAFWVYIYDANKDHIVNPDKIVTGTPIRVPQLTKEQMDTTNTETQQILKRLTEQGEAAKRR